MSDFITLNNLKVVKQFVKDNIVIATDEEVDDILATTHVPLEAEAGVFTIPASSVDVGDDIYVTGKTE